MPKVILNDFIRTIIMSRDSVHQRIDELLGLISIHNSRLSLHSDKLSQLDIDVLRKHCIDLYAEINLLALQGKIRTNKAVESHKVEAPAPKVKEPAPREIVKEIVQEKTQTPEQPPAPIEVEHIVVPQVPEPTTPAKEPEPVEQRSTPAPNPKPIPTPKPEDEMLSLFEKFSSNPIDKIAKGMSLAKRFEFQSAFFDGDNKEYNSFINQLDNATDREDAFRVYHEYKNKHEWDNEELKDELKALIYRKHS